MTSLHRQTGALQDHAVAREAPMIVPTEAQIEAVRVALIDAIAGCVPFREFGSIVCSAVLNAKPTAADKQAGET